MALKDSKGAQALLTFLATPESAEIWAKEGGFLSPTRRWTPPRTPTTCSGT
ncbi:hypothetical protein ACFQVA_27230 [Actinomadura keratinilytica]